MILPKTPLKGASPFKKGLLGSYAVGAGLGGEELLKDAEDGGARVGVGGGGGGGHHLHAGVRGQVGLAELSGHYLEQPASPDLRQTAGELLIVHTGHHHLLPPLPLGQQVGHHGGSSTLRPTSAASP